MRVLPLQEGDGGLLHASLLPNPHELEPLGHVPPYSIVLPLQPVDGQVSHPE